MKNVNILEKYSCCEGVSFEGSFDITWGKQTWELPRYLVIDYQSYFDGQKAKALAKSNTYTMPSFVPNLIKVDISRFHQNAVASVLCSQATPILKRFFNIFTNNYASVVDVDKAVSKVVESLNDGTCLRLKALGESESRLTPFELATNQVARQLAPAYKITSKDKERFAKFVEYIRNEYTLATNAKLVSAVDEKLAAIEKQREVLPDIELDFTFE